MKRLAKRYFLETILVGTFIPIIIGVVLGFRSSVYLERFYSFGPFFSKEMFRLWLLVVIGLGLSIYALIVLLIFIYRIWQGIQDGNVRTTPGKAVGCSVIPLFNIYWVFQVFWGFAKDYNLYLRRHDLGLMPLPSGLYLTFSFLNLLVCTRPLLGDSNFYNYLVLAAGLAQLIILMVIISQVSDAVNALVDLNEEIDEAMVVKRTVDPGTMIYCDNCGKESTYGLIVCTACGQVLKSKPTTPLETSPTIQTPSVNEEQSAPEATKTIGLELVENTPDLKVDDLKPELVAEPAVEPDFEVKSPIAYKFDLYNQAETAAPLEPTVTKIMELDEVLALQPRSALLLKLLKLPPHNGIAILRNALEPFNLITVDGVQERYNPNDYNAADLDWAEEARGLILEVETLVKAKKFTAAVLGYLKALQLIPGHEALLLGLGEAYDRLKKYDRATQVLEVAQKLHPEHEQIGLTLEVVRRNKR